MSDDEPFELDGGPYPYPLHTNRELEMMLAGAKPLAVFAHERVAGFTKEDAHGGQDFAPHVAAGRMSAHVRTFEDTARDGTPYSLDYYLYALPGEEWRVKAYGLLLEMLHRGLWCAQLEWLQGTLLGYSDEQNAYHLTRTYGEGWARAAAACADGSGVSKE